MEKVDSQSPLNVVSHSVLSTLFWYIFSLYDADSMLSSDVALKGSFHFGDIGTSMRILSVVGVLIWPWLWS